MGRIKEFATHTAASSTRGRGSTPAIDAISITRGASKTIAPTLVMTNEKIVDITPIIRTSRNTCLPSTMLIRFSARMEAVPVVCIAIPNGISPASKNTTFYSIAL